MSIVKNVVKNASRTGMVIFTDPEQEAFCVLAWLDCNFDGEVMQGGSAQGAAQNLRGNKQRNRAASDDQNGLSKKLDAYSSKNIRIVAIAIFFLKSVEGTGNM